jgi:hypothetical protein
MTVIVPVWPSWTWKLHSKGCSPGSVTVNSMVVLSPGASSGISAAIGSGPSSGVNRKLWVSWVAALVTVSRTLPGATVKWSGVKT